MHRVAAAGNIETLAVETYSHGISDLAVLVDGKTVIVAVKETCFLHQYDADSLRVGLLCLAARCMDRCHAACCCCCCCCPDAVSDDSKTPDLLTATPSHLLVQAADKINMNDKVVCGLRGLGGHLHRYVFTSLTCACSWFPELGPDLEFFSDDCVAVALRQLPARQHGRPPHADFPRQR